MTVDWSKVKVGDTIHVDYVVTHLPNSSPNYFMSGPTGDEKSSVFVFRNRAVGHTPKPTPLPSELPDGAYVIQKGFRGAGKPRHQLGPIWEGCRMVLWGYTNKTNIDVIPLTVLNNLYEAE